MTEQAVNMYTEVLVAQKNEDHRLKTASIRSSDMEVEREARTIKRKKAESPEKNYDSESSDPEPRSKVMRNRRQIIDNDNANTNANVNNNNNITDNNKALDEDKRSDANINKESIRIEKETDNTASEKKEEFKQKVGRPKKKIKAVDPLIAEREIVAKTGKAPEHIDEELLKSMTAADISAQALDYIEDMEHIRTKCGRL